MEIDDIFESKKLYLSKTSNEMNEINPNIK